MNESLGDYIEIIEEIENGHNDEFKWVDQTFIQSLKRQLFERNYLSDRQKEALRKIYTKDCK